MRRSGNDTRADRHRPRRPDRQSSRHVATAPAQSSYMSEQDYGTDSNYSSEQHYAQGQEYPPGHDLYADYEQPAGAEYLQYEDSMPGGSHSVDRHSKKRTPRHVSQETPIAEATEVFSQSAGSPGYTYGTPAHQEETPPVEHRDPGRAQVHAREQEHSSWSAGATSSSYYGGHEPNTDHWDTQQDQYGMTDPNATEASHWSSAPSQVHDTSNLPIQEEPHGYGHASRRPGASTSRKGKGSAGPQTQDYHSAVDDLTQRTENMNLNPHDVGGQGSHFPDMEPPGQPYPGNPSAVSDIRNEDWSRQQEDHIPVPSTDPASSSWSQHQDYDQPNPSASYPGEGHGSQHAAPRSGTTSSRKGKGRAAPQPQMQHESAPYSGQEQYGEDLSLERQEELDQAIEAAESAYAGSGIVPGSSGPYGGEYGTMQSNYSDDTPYGQPLAGVAEEGSTYPVASSSAPPPSMRAYQPKEKIYGTGGEDYERVDRRFVIERSYRWNPGVVLKVLWTEPHGNFVPIPKDIPFSEIRREKSDAGRSYYLGYRRFIVVATGDGHSQCVPILTYEYRGCTKKGVHADTHGIIYPYGQNPARVQGEPELGFRPVALDIHVESETLAPQSRVNYSKLVTIEHNVKVFFIGSIVPEDFDIVGEAVDQCWMKKIRSHKPSGSSGGGGSSKHSGRHGKQHKHR